MSKANKGEQGFTLDFSEARARVLNDCTSLPFINNPSSTLSLEQPPVLPRTAFISSNYLSSFYYVSALLHIILLNPYNQPSSGYSLSHFTDDKLQFRELKKLLQSHSASKQKIWVQIFAGGFKTKERQESVTLIYRGQVGGSSFCL